MSAFGGGGGGVRGSGGKQGSSSSSEQNEEDSTNPALNFFRRVKDAVTRPVPGLVKVTNSAPSSSSATKAAAAAAAATGGAQKSSGEGAGKQAAAPQAGLKKAAASATSKPGASKTAAASAATAAAAAATAAAAQRKPYRIGQFDQILESENIDLTQLRKLSWNGIPAELRPTVWQMMLGYVPTNKARREVALERKRKEYVDSIPLYFDTALTGGGSGDASDIADRTTHEGELLRQILVDLPRTSPDLPFFQQAPIQKMMERILYIWSIRHPASGYVQGMNDLLTPLLLVAMQPYAADKANALRCDVATISPTALAEVEADAYWSLTKLLDGIQDHYTFSQPGLQRMVLRLEDLIRRHSPALDKHFQDEGIQYMQFAFRWMNCLLLRELPLRAALRLWDTYLAEAGETSAGFENFHVYVCAVFLKEHEAKLLGMQFQEILMFLQELPTGEWGEDEVEPVLSQAFILSTLYENGASHLADR